MNISSNKSERPMLRSAHADADSTLRNQANRRQVLDCASPLALLAGTAPEERSRSTALQDAAAPAPALASTANAFRTLVWAFFLSFASVALAGLPKEGDPFPDLAKYQLEGSIPDLHGKIVLVDFFASWCEPCKESFPAMEELQQKYGAKGLVIVAINVDKKKEDMEEFLKKHPVTFTILRDASNKLVNDVKIPTMPSSFLLDRNGKVVAFHRGFKGAETRKKYAEQIEPLLK